MEGGIWTHSAPVKLSSRASARWQTAEPWEISLGRLPTGNLNEPEARQLSPLTRMVKKDNSHRGGSAGSWGHTGQRGRDPQE